ncbi:MFS transporter [Saccharothrix coeruleofusca]|nr:MFS transporter [Saccharothrix coeruleofusca]
MTRHPLGAPFWRLWASSGLSNLADGLVKVALPLAAAHATRSPVLVAGVAVVTTLPWLLFALPAGALVDRVDRRWAALGANTARAALAGVLAVAAAGGADSIWVLYAVALGVGIAETVHDTAAQSVLPALVPSEALPRANGRLFAVELTTNEFAGPPLAGLLVATGTTLAFGAPAALWCAAVAALWSVRGGFRTDRREPTALRADIAEGLRYLWRDRLLRTLAVTGGVFNFARGAVGAVLVLHAVGPGSAMGLSDTGFGLLLTAMAAGGLAGSLVAERVAGALGRTGSFALAVLAGTAMAGAPAVTTQPLPIGAAFFAGGMGVVVWNVVALSLRQRTTPDRLLGRVTSGSRLLLWGSLPLGAAAGGVLGQAFGLRAVFAASALLTLGLLTGVLAVARR